MRGEVSRTALIRTKRFDYEDFIRPGIGARRCPGALGSARGGQRVRAAGGGSPPPPKGFEADSASFVTANTGYVLGARKCSILPCTALLEKTVNGGKTWTKVPAPPTELIPTFTGSPRSAVSTVRFANAEDGWVFGPALWATGDGGARWHRVALPDAVDSLAVSSGEVFVAIAPIDGSLLNARLYKSKIGSGKWTLVRGVSRKTR